MTKAELLQTTKPILFNTEMVQAILNGKKTVTRRLIKPNAPGLEMWVMNDSHTPTVMDTIGRHYPQYAIRTPGYDFRGMILWVRETWCWCPCWDCGMNTDTGCCDDTADRFYNDQKKENGCYGYKASFETGELPFDKWIPSIHMPKEAARIFLRVTDIQVERLWDIDHATKIAAEGIDIGEHCRQCIENYGYPCCTDESEEGGSECGMLDDIRSSFADLWNSTIKPVDIDLYGWNTNPWVWVIEFERVKI